MKATWNGTTIAESDQTIIVEGNHYFPPESIQAGLFQTNTHQTTCPWKGLANYYDVVVDGEVNNNAAWYYPKPSSAASEIKGYVAFWKGVQIVK
ncbi:MAG: DUF427 domain-containing protein [Chloroflexi bacterium]|nr:DUF427 domain-containing protein [Chloroflexota bacterium]